MKNLIHSFLTIVIFIVCCSKCMAQLSDTTQHHRILIIPFQPEYYLSDAEQDIMQQTHKTPDEYRAYFRRVLDLKIEATLSTLIPCNSLMQDTSKSVRNDMDNYYSKAALKYEFPIASKQNKSIKIKSEVASKEIENQHSAPQYASIKGDTKFMNSTVPDTAFYKSLLTKYHADYLLSINQFEIKTNYKSCIDIANRIYRRELMIHYSLLDANGKVVQGNFITTYFPSNSNRDTEIAERVFPEIANLLKSSIIDLLK